MTASRVCLRRQSLYEPRSFEHFKIGEKLSSTTPPRFNVTDLPYRATGLVDTLSEALMLQPRVLAALLAYLEGRNASQDQIRKYIRYWRSSPRDPSVPCPNCYTFRGRHSGLTALHEKDGYMPLVCQTCNETYQIPLQ